MPWWLLLLAIPYWGAVWWLSDFSPFTACRTPRLEVRAAVVPAVPVVVRDCHGARLEIRRGPSGEVISWHGNNQSLDCGGWLHQPEAPLGDFPDRRVGPDFGKAERGFPTLQLQR